MLARLFGSKHPLAAPRADKRLAAIAKLTAEQAAKLRDEITACARADADVRVRRAALAWIDDRTLLDALLADDEIVEAVAARLVALGTENNHPAVRLAKLRHAESTEAALSAVCGVTAPEELVTLFLVCPTAFREALLPKLCASGERGLTMLERESRNHDKHANRTARVELDNLRGAKRAVDELDGRAEELRAALVQEATSTSARALQLRRAIEECAHSVLEQVPTLARYGLNPPTVEDWLPDTDAPPPTDEAPEADAAHFEALAADLQALDERMMAGEPLPALQEAQDELARRWLATTKLNQPDDTHKILFETVSGRFRELVEANDRLQSANLRPINIPNQPAEWPDEPGELQALWKRQRKLEHLGETITHRLGEIAWPKWATPPETLQLVHASLGALDEFVRGVASRQQSLESDLATLIDKVGTDVEEGHIQAAQSNLSKARTIVRSLPERVSQRHRKALAVVAGRVDELQDWQSFATSPKRQELLDIAKALAAEEPANAQDRAERVKALRNEWNALGPVAGARGRAMHAQFNRHAARAFEPCRTYFDEQANLRERNFAQRQLICEQLETYLDHVDWARADMRAAEQILRTARNEWRAHHPVDRRRVKALETRFEALQERIFTQIKRVWEANLEAKRAIVAAATELTTGDTSVDDKVRGAKALQRRWREVGITPRKPDQQLWRQFREQCDQIFDARDSNRKQASSERSSAIAQAEAICEKMRDAVAEAEAGDAKADRNTLSRLRTDLYAIKLPERLEKGLHKRFDDIARGYNQLILAGEIDALCEKLEQLRVWDVEVSLAEAAGHPIPPPAKCFENRSANANEPLPALHRLTLEAELLAGVESPPEDRQLRLEVQVEALNKNMGQGNADKEPRELAEAWCQLGPKSEASNALRERFFAALLKQARPYR